MDSFFSLLFNLLINPPGNYLYYLILAVLTGATLQNIYLSRRGEALDENRTRVMIGLFLLFIVQLVAVSSSLLSWTGLADPRSFLPPIDRAASLIMVGIIFWFWAFPDRSRIADSVFLAAGAIALLFLIGNLVNQFSLPPEIPFNATLWDWVWQILTMIMALIAVMALANRKPDSWQVGVGLFIIVLTGYVINLALLTNEGSFSGITRLALLIGFIMLSAIAQRFQPAPPRPVTQPVEVKVEQTTSKRDFEELETWLGLNSHPDLQTFFPALTRLVCQTIKADRCFVVVPSESRGQISLQAGYNNETGESFPLSSASDALFPAITRAAFFSRSQVFEQMENREELNHLAVTAQIAGIGSAIYEPFSPQQKKWGGLLVVKSSTRKALGNEDQVRIKTLAHSASQVLGKIVELSLHAHSLKTMAQELEEARRENLALKEDLKHINEQSGYERAEPELNALLAVQLESQDLIASLQRDNRQLQKELDVMREGSQQPEPEKGEADQAELSASKVHAVEALLEELRGPVDALEGSIGEILANPPASGEGLSEQALKAMHARLENLHSRLDDLEQTDVLVKGLAAMEAVATDVNQVIDQTLASTRAQLSQKALNLRIDIPEDLPSFYSYPGALKLTLARVVEYAIAASPIGADIELKVQAEDENEGEEGRLLFQVTDYGLKKEDGPGGEQSQGSEGQGKGGLVLARRLAEAHGGRMWDEDGENQASVLNILLPLRPLLSSPSEQE